jgi:hypothetical protein
MEVTFTRSAARSCQTAIRRDDGRCYSIPVFSVPRRLPHDLVHFAVEQALGWQTGFWGYVARGAVFPGMRQTAGRRPFHAERRARELIAPAKDLLGEAENLAATIENIVVNGLERNDPAIAQLFADAWWPPSSRAHDLPPDQIRRACAALRDAEASWQALAVGESLKLCWSLRRGPSAPQPITAPRRQIERQRRGNVSR